MSGDGWISKPRLRWSLENIDTLEKEIAKMYTQSFWNSFRRAPVVPHRLSDMAASRNPVAGQSHTPVFAPHVMNNPNIIINEEVSKR